MRHLLGLIALLSVAGCVGFGDGPTLVLTYTLTNESDVAREAHLGPHRGTAKVDEDVARIEKDAYESLGETRPFLIVDGASERGRGFTSMGSEGFPQALPAIIDPQIDGNASVLATIAMADGKVTVDWTSVDLPHVWSAMAADGSWRANLTLRQGPAAVRLFESKGCM